MMRTLLLAATLALSASAVHAASFDCAKARLPDEKTICAYRSLSEADVKMATLFNVDTRLVAMGERGNIQDAQAEWLKNRHACGRNVACLTRSYNRRIAELQAEFDSIASRGPF
ncbi:MAG: hypothetical protein WDN06_04300 [Asticcacaulis sp.]